MKGWIECVGCADRSAYDLTKHSERVKTKLVVREALDEPLISEVWEPTFDRGKLGPKFKADGKALMEVIAKMSQLELENCKKELEAKGEVAINVGNKKLVVDKDLMQIERVSKKETGTALQVIANGEVYEYTPNVIEPSFGIGRILYSLIEHTYWPRPEDKQRGVHNP